jgi:predicted AlkP superfamily phosphohydrolase/phosphomutase
MSKALVIGLDGATWSLLAPWARAGRLPALAALMERGTWGVLESTVPALTLPAWSSFMTGKNPGGHGVFAFRRLTPDRYENVGLANASDLRATTIWDVAAAAGRRVGVINVPPSYPIRPVPNGFVVSCMLTPPGQPFTDPPEVAAELGEYEIDLPPPKGLTRGSTDYRARALQYLVGMRRQTRLRGDATIRMMSARPTDALCVVFYAPDRVQHYFWEYVDPAVGGPGPDEPEIREALLAVYEELDRAVGKLVDAAGPETAVILLSDHGFRTKPERSVHVNRWLVEQGLLRRYPFWRLRRRIVRRVLPEPWRSRFDTTEHILFDQARSRAWAETLFTGTCGIWVHVRGRYPLGCIEPGVEYEDVRSQIVTGLSALRDDRGRPVFRSVRRREEVYRGPFVDHAPDLLAECEPQYGSIFASLRRELKDTNLFGPYQEMGYTGTHDPAGLYLFAGGPFQALGEHQAFPIEAIASTLLYVLGIPIPSDLEAPPCTSAIDPAVLAAQPVETSEPLPTTGDAGAAWRSGEDETQVAEHLRALGYLE